MILLTQELRERLLANGGQIDADHVPVVKLFSPLGQGLWLATELDADGDTLFGLADLALIERLAQAADTSPVPVRCIRPFRPE